MSALTVLLIITLSIIFIGIELGIWYACFWFGKNEILFWGLIFGVFLGLGLLGPIFVLSGYLENYKREVDAIREEKFSNFIKTPKDNATSNYKKIKDNDIYTEFTDDDDEINDYVEQRTESEDDMFIQKAYYEALLNDKKNND